MTSENITPAPPTAMLTGKVRLRYLKEDLAEARSDIHRMLADLDLMPPSPRRQSMLMLVAMNRDVAQQFRQDLDQLKSYASQQDFDRIEENVKLVEKSVDVLRPMVYRDDEVDFIDG